MKRVVVLAMALVGCVEIDGLLDDACAWETQWREPAQAPGGCLRGTTSARARLRLAGDTCSGWSREIIVRDGDLVEAAARPGERLRVGDVEWQAVACEQ